MLCWSFKSEGIAWAFLGDAPGRIVGPRAWRKDSKEAAATTGADSDGECGESLPISWGGLLLLFFWIVSAWAWSRAGRVGG